MDEYQLEFISQIDFENHVKNTLEQYQKNLSTMDLKKFNNNIIDPIKLLFDKNVSNNSFEEIIKAEIDRQMDKSNNNCIGYFHQNIFKYIKKCVVPKEGWDVIFEDKDGTTYYVEMKNKYNTMNSSSTQKTYVRFCHHLMNNNNSKDICALVEVIAKNSQNIEWVITLDKEKQKPNERLRRISIDKFYELVTGDKLAFYKLCQQLPITIKKLVSEYNISTCNDNNLVISELKELDSDLLIALYKLAFNKYEGFNLL